MKQLTKREQDICRRFKYARETIGISQKDCADWIGIKRSTLTNYESGMTPIPYDVALRFCYEIVVSEEWLATGETPSLWLRASQLGITVSDWVALPRWASQPFYRQSMDLLYDPECQRFPVRMLFSAAYKERLKARYAELAAKFFFIPRFYDSEVIMRGPKTYHLVIDAELHKWFSLTRILAQSKRKHERHSLQVFMRGILKANAEVFLKYAQADLGPRALHKQLFPLESKINEDWPDREWAD